MIEGQSLRIDGAAIEPEKCLVPRVAEVAADAARGEGQILMPVGDAQSAAIDEAGEPALVGDQVGQAGITVSDHQVFAARPAGQEFLEKIARRLALAFGIEVRFIDRAGLDAGAGVLQPAIDPVVEGAGNDVELVQTTQRAGGDLDDLVGSQLR